MSRESKVIKATVWDAEKTIQHYESFGWELLSLNGSQITMTRETQNPVYQDLVKFQAKYEQKLSEYHTILNPKMPKAPEPFSWETLGKCFIALIIPAIVYITVKIVQNNKHKKAMEEYSSIVAQLNAKRQALISEMEQITLDSRGTFFAQQK